MKVTHSVIGTPKEFTKKVNALIASRDVGLRLRSLVFNAGLVSGLVEELPQGVNVTGSLVTVSASRADEAAPLIADLAAENPCWHIEAVFPACPAPAPAAVIVEGQEAKPADGKPADGKPADGKPADGKTPDAKTPDAKPAKKNAASGVVVIAVLTQP